MPRRFDALGLDETFTFWSVVPPRSVFAGVSELRPGTWRSYQLFSDGSAPRVREQPYWKPRYPTAISGHGSVRLWKYPLPDKPANSP
jgi:asparagine synthase (glutamine-hydrolysing)